MALNAYMRFTGNTQGEVKGSVTQAGREDSIMVIGMSHSILAMRDAASGQSTGKRQHKPLTVTKETDKATPGILLALTQNEEISNAELRFWKPNRAGREEQYYTIQLERGTIADYRQEMLNNKYPDNASHAVREHVSFTYEKIIWTYEDGGITAEDDWEAPVA